MTNIIETHDWGRLFFHPVRVAKGTWPITLTHSWEVDEPHRFAHTVVARFWPLRLGIAVGWWQDTDVVSIDAERWYRSAVEEANASYDAYVAVNGPVEREWWDNARKTVAARGLDLDDEMEVMQSLGIFGEPE